MSRIVNEFVSDTGTLITISEQESFSLLARMSWDAKARLHFTGRVRWIKKKLRPTHPYG